MMRGMSSPRLANAIDEVSRLLGGATPPVTPDLLRGDTRVTGRWVNSPYEGYVPALNEHCLVCHFGGHSKVWAKLDDGKVLTGSLMPGTVTVVPRGQGGSRVSRGPIEVSNVFLGSDRLHDCADLVAHGQRPELIGRSGVSDPKLFAIMTLLSDEAEMPGGGSRLFIERGIDLLCLQLLRAHSSLDTPPRATARRGLATWQVKRISAYMRDNLERDMSLQDLADQVGLSRFHFCHAFRLATGSSPHEWLTQLRIERARHLLASPQLRIIDVALAVGYQTPSAFTARFRKLLGMTPTEFRARL
jgi:AraC family transcriptional regulator